MPMTPTRTVTRTEWTSFTLAYVSDENAEKVFRSVGPAWLLSSRYSDETHSHVEFTLVKAISDDQKKFIEQVLREALPYATQVEWRGTVTVVSPTYSLERLL